MARTTFKAEVLTPEGEVFNDEVEMVSTRTTVGSIGILANHTPLLGMLEPTELRLYKSESDIVRLAQGEGYVQVAEGRVLILVEEASDPSSLDAGSLRDKLATAERELEQAEDGSEAARVALRDKRRWEAFLRLAEGGGGEPGRGHRLPAATFHVNGVFGSVADPNTPLTIHVPSASRHRDAGSAEGWGVSRIDSATRSAFPRVGSRGRRSRGTATGPTP
jgi:F-type H+-transporting ATPase subunit epsilon